MLVDQSESSISNFESITSTVDRMDKLFFGKIQDKFFAKFLMLTTFFDVAINCSITNNTVIIIQCDIN